MNGGTAQKRKFGAFQKILIIDTAQIMIRVMDTILHVSVVEDIYHTNTKVSACMLKEV